MGATITSARSDVLLVVPHCCQQLGRDSGAIGARHKLAPKCCWKQRGEAELVSAFGCVQTEVASFLPAHPTRAGCTGAPLPLETASGAWGCQPRRGQLQCPSGCRTGRWALAVQMAQGCVWRGGGQMDACGAVVRWCLTRAWMPLEARALAAGPAAGVCAVLCLPPAPRWAAPGAGGRSASPEGCGHRCTCRMAARCIP